MFRSLTSARRVSRSRCVSVEGSGREENGCCAGAGAYARAEGHARVVCHVIDTPFDTLILEFNGVLRGGEIWD